MYYVMLFTVRAGDGRGGGYRDNNKRERGRQRQRETEAEMLSFICFNCRANSDVF